MAALERPLRTEHGNAGPSVEEPALPCFPVAVLSYRDVTWFLL
jgi:hypothetical protein